MYMYLSLACYGLQFVVRLHVRVDLLGGKILVFCIMIFPAETKQSRCSVVAVSEHLPCPLSPNMCFSGVVYRTFGTTEREVCLSTRRSIFF